MDKLPYRLIEPFFWWSLKAPRRIWTVLRRVLILTNHEVGFTLSIRLLFVPFFGDYTIAGRIIGFVIRIFQIVLGSILLIILIVLMYTAPVAWYLVPFVLIYYLRGYAFFIFLVVYLLRVSLTSNLPRKRISESKPEEYLSAVRPQCFDLLEKTKSTGSLSPFLTNYDVSFLLQKVELDKPDFKETIENSTDFEIWKILRKSFDVAKEHDCRYVEIEHVFYALLNSVHDIDRILMSFGSSMDIIKEGLIWIVDERERLSQIFFWQEDYHLDRLGGFGRGMTGRVTPNLDAVSTDYTKLAKKGLIRGIIAHQKEIEQIADILSGSEKVNVLIVGQPGSGKTSIVKGIAKSVVEGTEYERIQNKRIVSVEAGRLVSGARSPGELAENFKKIMDDVHGSGDIILFFDEIHNLVSSISGEASDIASAYSILEPYLTTGKIQVLAATNRNTYRKYIEPNGAFARLFNVIDIEPSTLDETEEILKHLTLNIERDGYALVTLPAIKRIVRLSDKLLFERVFPDKAVDMLNRCVQSVSKDSRVVNSDLVSEVLSNVTHVPVTSISEEDSEKLLNLENIMKERVIGQSHAVKQVSSALKRARVGIRDEDKPMASFLFVGSTGVGKTETAKTLADVYFGAEDKMIRLDMSEYQHPDSINRLLGSPNEGGKGLLTEAIRANPFSVVLLDEIEKAHSEILLTFLQVLDDGRLTDSSGMTVNFSNTIIIATSNVGTREIQAVAKRGGTFNEMEEAVLHEVRSHYAPEFLNRFSGLIVFNPLSPEDVEKIARNLLSSVEKLAREKDITLTFSDSLLERLVKEGYDPEWGARPLKRVIEDRVQTYLAEKILSKEVVPGDSIELTEEIF